MAWNISKAKRRALVALQLRDKNGRFIDMGKSVKWYSSKHKAVVSGTVEDGEGTRAIVRMSTGPEKGRLVHVEANQIEVIESKASLNPEAAPKADAPEADAPAAPEAKLPNPKDDPDYAATMEKYGDKEGFQPIISKTSDGNTYFSAPEGAELYTPAKELAVGDEVIAPDGTDPKKPFSMGKGWAYKKAERVAKEGPQIGKVISVKEHAYAVVQLPDGFTADSVKNPGEKVNTVTIGLSNKVIKATPELKTALKDVIPEPVYGDSNAPAVNEAAAKNAKKLDMLQKAPAGSTVSAKDGSVVFTKFPEGDWGSTDGSMKTPEEILAHVDEVNGKQPAGSPSAFTIEMDTATPDLGEASADPVDNQTLLEGMYEGFAAELAKAPLTDYAHSGKDEAFGAFDGFNEVEADAVTEYVGSSIMVNSALRNGKVEDSQIAAQILGMDSILDRSVLLEDAKVYRGIGASAGMLDSILKKGVFNDRAFSSTSVDQKLADSWVANTGTSGITPVVMEIDLPKGFKAHKVDYDLVGSGFDHENEVVLPRGLDFDIVEVQEYTNETGQKGYRVKATPILNDKNYKAGETNDTANPGNGADSGPAGGDSSGGPAPAGDGTDSEQSGQVRVDGGSGDIPDTGGSPEASPAESGDQDADGPLIEDAPKGARRDRNTIMAELQELDTANWKKVGAQAGSNPGGVFEDENGQKWYVKQSKSDAHARAEVLSDQLYKASGIDAAGVKLAKVNGKLGTASPMIDGAKDDLYSKYSDKTYMDKIREGFAVDAWLANWDVLGLEDDNIITNAEGNPVRIDTGGTLMFRAQGGLKNSQQPGAWGNEVKDWDGLRQFGTAPKAFKDMSDQQMVDSAARVEAVTPEEIDAMVDALGYTGGDALHVANILKARREDIIKKAAALDVSPTAKDVPENQSSESDAPAPAPKLVEPTDAPAADDEPFEPVLPSQQKAQEKAKPKYPKATKENPNVLQGYTMKQTADGVYYPEERLDMNAWNGLRKGTIVPPNLPFIPFATDSGEVHYWDSEGNKHWGQFGGAGALTRRKNANGEYEYLLAQRASTLSTAPNMWSTPGGAHTSKADSQGNGVTAKIELEEELGMVVHGEPVANYKHSKVPDWSYDYSIFDAPSDGEPDMDAVDKREIQDLKWMTAEEINALKSDGTLHPAMAEVLDDLLAASESVQTDADEATTPESDSDAPEAPSEAVEEPSSATEPSQEYNKHGFTPEEQSEYHQKAGNLAGMRETSKKSGGAYDYDVEVLEAELEEMDALAKSRGGTGGAIEGLTEDEQLTYHEKAAQRDSIKSLSEKNNGAYDYDVEVLQEELDELDALAASRKDADKGTEESTTEPEAVEEPSSVSEEAPAVAEEPDAEESAPEVDTNGPSATMADGKKAFVGSRVVHKKLGAGTVIQIIAGKSAKVEYDDGTVKIAQAHLINSFEGKPVANAPVDTSGMKPGEVGNNPANGKLFIVDGNNKALYVGDKVEATHQGETKTGIVKGIYTTVNSVAIIFDGDKKPITKKAATSKSLEEQPEATPEVPEAAETATDAPKYNEYGLTKAETAKLDALEAEIAKGWTKEVSDQLDALYAKGDARLEGIDVPEDDEESAPEPEAAAEEEEAAPVAEPEAPESEEAPEAPAEPETAPEEAPEASEEVPTPSFELGTRVKRKTGPGNKQFYILGVDGDTAYAVPTHEGNFERGNYITDEKLESLKIPVSELVEVPQQGKQRLKDGWEKRFNERMEEKSAPEEVEEPSEPVEETPEAVEVPSEVADEDLDGETEEEISSLQMWELIDKIIPESNEAPDGSVLTSAKLRQTWTKDGHKWHNDEGDEYYIDTIIGGSENSLDWVISEPAEDKPLTALDAPDGSTLNTGDGSLFTKNLDGEWDLSINGKKFGIKATDEQIDEMSNRLGIGIQSSDTSDADAALESLKKRLAGIEPEPELAEWEKELLETYDKDQAEMMAEAAEADAKAEATESAQTYEGENLADWEKELLGIPVTKKNNFEQSTGEVVTAPSGQDLDEYTHVGAKLVTSDEDEYVYTKVAEGPTGYGDGVWSDQFGDSATSEELANGADVKIESYGDLPQAPAKEPEEDAKQKAAFELALSFVEEFPIGTKLGNPTAEHVRKTDTNEWSSFYGNDFISDDEAMTDAEVAKFGLEYPEDYGVATATTPEDAAAAKEAEAEAKKAEDGQKAIMAVKLFEMPEGSIVGDPTSGNYRKIGGKWTPHVENVEVSWEPSLSDQEMAVLAFENQNIFDVDNPVLPAAAEPVEAVPAKSQMQIQQDLQKLPIGSKLGDPASTQWQKIGPDEWIDHYMGEVQATDTYNDWDVAELVKDVPKYSMDSLIMPEGAVLTPEAEEPTPVGTLGGLSKEAFAKKPVGTKVVYSNTGKASEPTGVYEKTGPSSWSYTKEGADTPSKENLDGSIFDHLFSADVDNSKYSIDSKRSVAAADEEPEDTSGVIKDFDLSNASAALDSFPVGTTIKKNQPASNYYPNMVYYVKQEDGMWQEYKKTPNKTMKGSQWASSTMSAYGGLSTISKPLTANHAVLATGEIAYVGDTVLDGPDSYTIEGILKSGINVVGTDGVKKKLKPHALKKDSQFGVGPSHKNSGWHSNGMDPLSNSAEGYAKAQHAKLVAKQEADKLKQALENFGGGTADEYDAQGLTMPSNPAPKVDNGLTVLDLGEPDTDNPLYGVPKPVKPSDANNYPPFNPPTADPLPKWDSEAWLKKVEQRYLDNPNKAKATVQQSNKWSAIQTVLTGDKSQLDNLVGSMYLDDDLRKEAIEGIDAQEKANSPLKKKIVDNAKAAKEAYDAKKAEDLKDLNAALDKYHKDLDEWVKANPSPDAYKKAKKPPVSTQAFEGGEADWTKGPVGTYTAKSVMDAMRDDNVLGSHGLSIATDSDQIEDLDVKVTKVLDKNGDPKFEFKFKLTAPHGAVFESALKADDKVIRDTAGIYPSNMVKDASTGLFKDSGKPSSEFINNGTRYSYTDQMTGAKIVFQRAENTSGLNVSSNNNTVKIHMPVDSTPEQYQQTLENLGIKKARPSTAGDLRVLAENKLIYLMGTSKNGVDVIDGTVNMTGEDRKKTLQEIKDTYGVTPDDMTFSAEPNGRVRFFLNEEKASEFAKKYNVGHFFHDVKGGFESAERWITMLSGKNPGMLSTYHRFTEGINKGGISSWQDMSNGSGDYNYVTPKAPNSDTHAVGIFIKPTSIFKRTDFWANPGDGWGKKSKTSDGPQSNKAPYKLFDSKVNKGTTGIGYEYGNNSVYEVLPKDSIPLSDWSHVTVPTGFHQEIIDALLAKGITEINGMPLDKFIIKPGQTPPTDLTVAG